MNECVSPGEGMGNPPSRAFQEHDGGLEGATRPQPPGGPHRVAPHRQQHPLQHRI